jgi:hypothetical protein
LDPKDVRAEDDPAEFQKVSTPPDCLTTDGSGASVNNGRRRANSFTYLNLSHVRDFVHGQFDVPNQHIIQSTTVKMSSEKKE